MSKLKPYPIWVCPACAVPAARAQGLSMPDVNRQTFHIDKCDICGGKTIVTEPRDYGYPKFEGHEE